MRKSLLAAAALMLAAPAIQAQINLRFADAPEQKQLIVRHVLVNDLLSQQEPQTFTDTVQIASNQLTLPLEGKGDARYRISFPDGGRNDFIDFFTSPGDTIFIDVESNRPLVAGLSGTPLIDGMSQIKKSLAPIEQKVRMIQSGQLPQSEFTQLAKDYDKVLADFIDANPASPAAIYALISMDENFDQYLAKLDPSLQQSVLWPFLEQEIAQRKKAAEMQARSDALASGNVVAPDFTLNDVNGKPVSLASFRGKWVVLDFWGSWCMWCIKGFPALKEAYAKHQGKLEIIGIDCRDTPEAWKTAVAKFKLPWINVYNPDQPGNLLETYPVQGFPTKVIINPEGKIQKIITGEDPDFYPLLDSLIK